MALLCIWLAGREKRAPVLPSLPVRSSNGSTYVLCTHTSLALPPGLGLVPGCLLMRRGLGDVV